MYFKIFGLRYSDPSSPPLTTSESYLSNLQFANSGDILTDSDGNAVSFGAIGITYATEPVSSTMDPGETQLWYNTVTQTVWSRTVELDGTTVVDVNTGAAAVGDMLKSTYDSNGDGIVDAAGMLKVGATELTATTMISHIADTSIHGVINDAVASTSGLWSSTKITAAFTALGTMSAQDADSVAITGGSIAGITDLAVADGGTGASTAAAARTNLGLGTISVQEASAVAITGGSIAGITDLALADGGTGSSTAAGARTNLGLGTIATQDADSVAITGGAISGVTISMIGTIPVVNGGTGAATAGNARLNLGLGTISVQSAASVAITGGTIAGITDLALADGGTGASTAGDARTNLGLGTMAVQASSAVSISGGTITGITDLALADGGTGASTASAARTNLGLGGAAVLNVGVTVGTVAAGNHTHALLLPSGAVQGNIAYYGASGWANLAVGTTGYALKTKGAAADPAWEAVGDVSSTANIADNSIIRGDGTAKNVQKSVVSIDDTGNIIPDVDNAQELGSAALTFKDLHFTDINGIKLTARDLSRAHRIYSDGAALTDFSIVQSTAASVWTITLTDTGGSGHIHCVVAGKTLISTGDTLSVDATALAGTTLNPKTVYVYINNNGADLPQLVASLTNPDVAPIDHVHVANYIAGTVGVSSTYIHVEKEAVITMANTATKLFHRFFIEGSIFVSGLETIATSTDVTIGVGIFNSIFDDTPTTETQVSVDGLFYIKSDGTYNLSTAFDFGTEYSTGETISNNKFFNVVLGVVGNGSTVPHALVQKGSVIPSGKEYKNVKEAIEDKYGALRTQSADAMIKSIFTPVCRIIVKRDGATYTLQEIPEAGSGIYFLDIRGIIGAGGGGIGGGSGLPSASTNGDMLQYADAGAAYATLSPGAAGTSPTSNGVGELMTMETGLMKELIYG